MSQYLHLFAFFLPNLTQMLGQSTAKIDNEELMYRLFGIVRKQIGDQVIFFDDQHYATAVLIECNKRSAIVKFSQINRTTNPTPTITVGIGLTKKPAFEEALYSCAAMEVSQVVPLITEQVERNWFGPKEIARLNRIVVTAREQAKNYAPLTIYEPTALSLWLKQMQNKSQDCLKIVFEKHAQGLNSALSRLEQAKEIVLVFGPEGGLFKAELELLGQHNFEMLGLVPTTLRTQEAATVAVGTIKSLTLK